MKRILSIAIAAAMLGVDTQPREPEPIRRRRNTTPVACGHLDVIEGCKECEPDPRPTVEPMPLPVVERPSRRMLATRSQVEHIRREPPKMNGTRECERRMRQAARKAAKDAKK